MTNGAMAANSGAAAAAVISSAIKASGAIIRIEPGEFQDLVARVPGTLVVWSRAGWLTSNKYLTCYKGLYFYAKSKMELAMPTSVELIEAKKIWVPEM